MSNGNSSSSSKNTISNGKFEQVAEQVEIESEKQSGYIKLKDGQVRTLKFNLNKVELVDNEFDGKVTKRVEYKVIDPNTDEGEKTLSMAISNARRINRLLGRGKNTLEIERIGSGLDTIYNISAA